ncbi:MAG: SulP family inorganic anion transporter [Caldilineales bacterium]|nr:SulP family inorganic anion transporter [Caldilineales bacterium]
MSMNLVGEWRTLLRREFSNYSFGIFQKDLLAGLTVAAVALPLALAFGVASGADAAAGLVTAVIAGVIIGFLSGAPYQVSGPTGAMSAVLIVLASRYGMQGMWLAGLLAGAMLLVLGIFRLGRVVALIPAPVISGFTSGIAVIIALGQIDNALGIQSPPAENTAAKLLGYFQQDLSPNPYALLVTVLVMAVMIVWPRFKWGHRLPGSLVGIILATLVVVAGGWDVPTIGAIPRSILLENRLSLGAVPWQDLDALVIPAMSIAALGAIESLLCGAVAGNMTGIRLHNSVELVAQGVGNLVIPFFGGVPATAAIARTSVNIKSGGVTRMTSIIHGIALALVALLAASIIGRVPMAALAGVLFITAWRMNEWHAIHFYFGKRLKHAMIAFTVTLVATVMLDLTQAIIIGFGISTLIFMSQMSDLNITRQPVDASRLAKSDQKVILPAHPISVYYLVGPLFFAAARKLVESIEAQDRADATLILSMRGVPLIDATGVEALREIWHRQHKGGGNLLLSGLPARSESLVQRSGFLDELGAQRLFWSADQAILSLGVSLPAAPETRPDDDEFDATLIITPHEDRAMQNI